MKHLRGNVCVALLVLVVCLVVGITLTSGVSFADGNGGQTPPPTGGKAIQWGVTLLTCAVCTTTILSSL